VIRGIPASLRESRRAKEHDAADDDQNRNGNDQKINALSMHEGLVGE
jgi:hypothetical protein